MTCSFRPYEGKEPYIFASYSHRDNERVIEILNHLAEAGFRIWFDEGIEWGSEWPESIAERLDGCCVCMVFISGSSVQSANCRQEIRYALKQGKPLLSVYLEEVVLSKGMDMQLSPYQQTYPFQYGDMGEFFKRLDVTPVLQPCRAPEPESPSPAPEEEKASAAREEPKKSRKPAVIAGICAGALAVLALAAGLILGRGSGDDVPGSQPDSSMTDTQDPPPAAPDTPEGPEAPEEPEEPAEALPPYQVILSGGDLSVKEYPAALELLRGRLDAMSNGCEYQMTVDGSSVNLVIPREMLKNVTDFQGFLLSALISPMKLYLVAEADNSVYLEISREDIAGAEVVTGLIDGVSPADLGFEGDNYKYIELTLTDEAAARLAEHTAEWGPVFIAEDVTASRWFYFDTYPDEGLKTIRVVGSQNGSISESLAYSYANPTFDHQFQFTIVLNDVVWDEPDGDPAHSGQCAGEIEGETVILDLTPTTEITDGEWLDTQSAIQARLEALGQPYALGTRPETGRSLCIKTSTQRLGEEIVSLLISHYSYTSIQTDMYSLSYSFDSVEVTQLEDGRWAMVMGMSNTYREKLNEQLAASNDSEILFTIGTTEYLGGGPDSFSDGKLVLDTIPFLGIDSIGDDMRWYLDFLKAVITGRDSASYVKVREAQFGDMENGAYVLVDENLRRAQEQLTASAARIAEGSSAAFDGHVAYVSLRLPVDEAMPELSVELTRKIYEEINFPDSPFSDLFFYLCQENNDEVERARIIIHKYYSVSLTRPGYIYVTGIFTNGRLDAVKDAFKAAVESSDFLNSLTVEGNTFWNFG